MKKRISKIFHFQPFSPKQRKILNWWCQDSPVKDYDGIIADGAIRSGKTLSMSLSFVLWAMSCFSRQNFAMCGKTIGSFRRNVLSGLTLMLRSRGYRVADHRADNLMIVTKSGVENSFYLFGGKDESSQDLIQGITLAGCFFDEVALMPESFVNQATGRCSVTGSKFWFNCNPDGPYHWFKQNWIDPAVKYASKSEGSQAEKETDPAASGLNGKKLLYVHFTMDDNLSLSEEIKARYRSLYKGVFFKRYIKGLWCMAEGLIYDMFEEKRHVVELTDVVLPEEPEYYVSCDYGTQNATVFLLWVKDVNQQWICIREYYYSGREEQRQKAPSDFADDLGKWLAGIVPEKIVVDPAAASFIAELKKKGYRTKKAKNDVLEGIRYVASLLSLNRIAVCDTCKNTIKEFASYAWDAKAAERGEDAPVKKSDHCMDALRYFAYTIIRRPSGMTILK